MRLCPCTAVVSGIEKCGKTTALKALLHHAVQTKYRQALSPAVEEACSVEDKECLSCYKVIILGAKPFEMLTWLMSTSEEDEVVMCLVSYLASLCKREKPDSPGAYHRLLEFSPDTSRGTWLDSEVRDQIELLYSKLKKEWNRLTEDENIQAVMPNGVCLLNIFDVGSSRAAQAFCPFLNKYCKQSLNIACYNAMDADILKIELAEETDHQYYQSKKYQLLKPLSGCIHKEQIVNLTAIQTNSKNQESQQLHVHEHGLRETVKRQLEVEEVHPLHVSLKLMENTKVQLENSVKKAPFFDDIPLQYMLLMHRVKTNCKSFWMKRGDMEVLSEKYMFKNGDLERFLRSFSSFGSIFYTHDIPSLREYVIVDIPKFVRCIHNLYQSSVKTAKHGLFKHSDEEQDKVVFEFLTILGIAAEVKSNQIVNIPGLSLDTATFYYYIPSARSYTKRGTTSQMDMPPSTSATPKENSVEFISLSGYSKENLQAILCEHFLLSADCLLIPMETINTTAIRFCKPGFEVDVQFTDVGNKVMISSLNNTTITEEKREEIYSRIFSANAQHIFQRQQLVEAFESVKYKHGYVQPEKMIVYAKELSAKCKDKHTLALKFGLSKEWLQQHMQDGKMTNYDIILCMLLEFKQTATHTQFKSTLQTLDKEILKTS